MLYGVDVKLFNVCRIGFVVRLLFFFVKNWVIVVGRNINVCVKMIGIMFEVFILRGM